MGLNLKEFEPKLISLGVITKVRGNKGEVVIGLISRYKEQYYSIRRLVIRPPIGADYELIAERMWFHKEKLIIKFRGCESTEQAQAMVGSEVLIAEKELPPTEEDYYYVFQLMGLRVFSLEGDYLGEVSDIICTGGTDVLVVRKEKGECLIPMAKEYLKEIDLKNKKMVIDPLEGLLEINEV